MVVIVPKLPLQRTEEGNFLVRGLFPGCISVSGWRMSRRRGSPVHSSCVVRTSLMGIVIPSTVASLARLPHEFYCVPPPRPEYAFVAYRIIGVRSVGSTRCTAKALERRLERLS